LTKTKTIIVGTFALALTLLAAAPNARAAEDAKQVNPYPLKTCLVSGEKLGSMGKPYAMTYKGQQVQFCCKGCVKDFNKEPDKFLAKMDKQVKAKTSQESHEGDQGHEGHNH
jgi:YHS domain-containing protein